MIAERQLEKLRQEPEKAILELRPPKSSSPIPQLVASARPQRRLVAPET